MGYGNWEKRLALQAAGEAVVLTPQHETPNSNDEGYYRKPITEKQNNAAGKPNGKNKIVGWVPVALFLDGATLVAHIGAGDSLREIDTPAAISEADFWTWCNRYPITDTAYFDVVKKGLPWPDMVAAEKPAEPVGRLAENQQPSPEATLDPELPPHEQHAKAIDTAIARSPIKVTSNDEAAVALGNKNLLAELRLDADKTGRAIYDPLYRAYTAEQKKWPPMVKRAEDHEKKLNTAILSWRELERKRLAKIAADEAAKAAKIESERAAEQAALDERNARAADRAIAAGVPEPEPLVLEPEPVRVVDAPVFEPAPLVATYGSRKIKEEVKTFLDTITDYDAVYTFLKADPKVKALLLELATAKVKAGFTVPGTTTREGLI